MCELIVQLPVFSVMHAICEIKQKIITIDMQLAVLYRCKTVAAIIMMLKTARIPTRQW